MMVRTRLYFSLLLLLAGFTYSLGAAGPLLFDDGVNLEPLHNVESHLVPWYAVVLTNPSSSVGRPVSILSFFINYWLFGFNIIAFKATNIILHLGTGVALYTFIRRLLRETIYRESRDRVALAVTACWLLSPLYVSTVLYVVQRMAMLSTLFSLLALASYLDLREAFARGFIRWGSLFLFCIYASAGVFSKENAVLLPLFLLVLELFFCAPIRDEHGRRLWRWAVTVLGVVPLLAAAILIFYKRAVFFDYSSRPFNISERLLTEARVLWSYIGALLVPRSSEFGLFHDDIQVSKSFFAPATTLISVLGWLGVVAAAMRARKIDAWRPIVGAMVFFLIGHLLESTAFPLEIYFEHRNYLPGVGIYLLLTLVVELAIKNKAISLAGAKIALCAYLIVFVVALSQRTLIWARYETIVYSSYQSHPNSPRAIIEAASQDVQYRKLDDALAKLKYARESNLAPELGLNIQTVWAYCWLDQPGLEDSMQELFGNVHLDGSPYTSIAMRQFNEQLMKKRCENVPYAQALAILANRIERYYKVGEFKTSEAKRVGNIDSLQIRVLEGLNLTGQTQETVDLVSAINRAGFGGFSSDLLLSLALIDVGRFGEARVLLDKLKADKSMAARMEADNIISVEAVYAARMKRKQEHGDG